MKFLSILLVSCSLLMGLGGCTYTVGSGNTITETRNVEAFSKIQVNGSMDVVFTQAETTSLVIEADDNIMELIETKVSNGELTIGFKKHSGSINPKKIEVRISNKLLEELSLNGSGSITTTNKITPPNELLLNIQGAGTIEAMVNVPAIKSVVSGSGSIQLSGECANQDVEVTGSGDFKGLELLSENAKVEVTGSGDVEVFADNKLDIRVTGSGDVKYRGKCQITSTKTGSGSIQSVN